MFLPSWSSISTTNTHNIIASWNDYLKYQNKNIARTALAFGALGERKRVFSFDFDFEIWLQENLKSKVYQSHQPKLKSNPPNSQPWVLV